MAETREGQRKILQRKINFSLMFIDRSLEFSALGKLSGKEFHDTRPFFPLFNSTTLNGIQRDEVKKELTCVSMEGGFLYSSLSCYTHSE